MYVWIDIPVLELEVKSRAESKTAQIDAFRLVEVDDITERTILGAQSYV